MNKKTSVRKIEQVFGKLNTLRYFIEDPEKDFHLRGLAKISGRSPSTISSNIGLLKKLGVVSAKSSRGLTLIRANTESQLYTHRPVQIRIEAWARGTAHAGNIP